MTATPPAETALDIRKWCVETALAHFSDDPRTALQVAAELVAILETGLLTNAMAGPMGGKTVVDFGTVDLPFVTSPARDTPADDACTAPLTVSAADTEPLDPSSGPPAGWPGPDPITFHRALKARVEESEQSAPDSWAMAEPPPEHPPDVPAMAAPPPGDDGAAALTDREQAVFDAILLNSTGGKWPSHKAIAELADMPQGSVQHVVERLLKKGYLARPGGLWRVAKDIAGAPA